jgi:hypothetical protein
MTKSHKLKGTGATKINNSVIRLGRGRTRLKPKKMVRGADRDHLLKRRSISTGIPTILVPTLVTNVDDQVDD